MGTLDGKVAFITGAARGQGRSHALALAEQGADIIALDICEQIDTVFYDLATEDDLAETVRLVEQRGRRAVARKADVRDLAGLTAVLDEGLDTFGRLDIVLANAGICMGLGEPERTWKNSIDVNLTGVWNTLWAARQPLIEGGRGGSIVVTSSSFGLKGYSDGSAAGLAYCAAKHGVVGLMRAFANELAPHMIRVNSIHPTGVNTAMVINPAMEKYLADNAEAAANGMQNAMPVELIERIDVTNAVLWLVSDAARYVTGVTLPVDAGFNNR